MTKFLSTFDVEEKEPDTLTSQFGNLTVVQKYVSELDYDNHVILIKSYLTNMSQFG